MSNFIPLQGGAYENRSPYASAQVCRNLYCELVPPNQGEPQPAIHHLTPGLKLLGLYGNDPWRCLYRATNGAVYGVCGTEIIAVQQDLSVTPLGTLPAGTSRVSMADNGTDLLIVDGSPRGFVLELASNAVAEVANPTGSFYGGDVVACLDGFFVLNRPNTNQFYVSNNISTTFDPLYIAAKAGKDLLISLAVINRELWLFGYRSTEIWQTSGSPDFPLQIMSGGIDHGCRAAFSIAQPGEQLFWLSRDRDGAGLVMQGAHYQAARISTHAIEHAIQGYAKIDDAIGWSYQAEGHTMYVLTFPSADATWVYDLSSKLWHQWSSSPDASVHRHRGTCHVEAYGHSLVGDWLDGRLYDLQFTALTDDKMPIRRVRTFPHIVTDADRVFYHRFVADMQTGTVPAGQPEPMLTLRWSDDAGASWSLPVTLGMGLAGAANTSLQFRRLSYARNRIFELSWDAPVQTTLGGAWVETSVART